MDARVRGVGVWGGVDKGVWFVTLALVSECWLAAICEFRVSESCNAHAASGLSKR